MSNRKFARVRRWMLPVIGLIVILTTVVLFQTQSITTPAELSRLIGVSLPASTANLHVEMRRDLAGYFIGDYHAYVRFELPAAAADTLLSALADQPVLADSQRPLQIFENAFSSSTPMLDIATANPPDWWTPAQTTRFKATYRSQSQTNGASQADSAWYIFDYSDRARVVVYGFLFEV